MASIFGSTSAFILDGSETNAGARVFVRHASTHIIDGSETGSAAARLFVKDSTARVIEGRAGPSDTKVHIKYAKVAVLDGRPQKIKATNCCLFMVERVAASQAVAATVAAYIIEME